MSPASHFVFVPLSIVSHTRSELNLAIQLLQLHPSLVITWIVTSYGLPLLQRELLLHPSHVRHAFKERFRPLELPDTLGRSTTSFSDDEVVASRFPAVFEAMMETKQHGTALDTQPCLVIFDLFRSGILDSVRAICTRLDGPAIPALAIMPTMAFTAFRYVASEKAGGVFENIEARLQRYLESGLSSEEAAAKAYRHASGKLLKLPGLPDMYDYEHSPHVSARSSPPDIRMACVAYHNAHNADGTIWLSTPEVETEELRLLEADLGHPTLAVGTQLSAEWLQYARTRPAENEPEERIDSFLEQALAISGPASLIYVSFGTLYWPNNRLDIIRVIVECIIASKAPFIIARGPAGQIEPEVAAAIEDSARGMLVEWAPQVRVLQHAATGLFLSHCGCGAVLESISAGVPMIALPFGSEQPMLAAHYMQVHRIGIQLHQFATGLDGLPVGNGDTIKGTQQAMRVELSRALSLLSGPERRPYMQRLARLGEKMRRSSRDGLAAKTMEGFAQYFTTR